MLTPSSPKSSGKPIFSMAKYASLASQIIAGLLLTLYLGKKADAYFHWINKLAWMAPSLFILFTLIKVVKETQKNK